MTPRELEAILHYYYSPEDLSWGDGVSMTNESSIHDWLLKEQLIKLDNTNYHGRFCMTERLEVFVKHLCDQKLPEQKWVIPK